jgi:hypothetical protein
MGRWCGLLRVCACTKECLRFAEIRWIEAFSAGGHRQKMRKMSDESAHLLSNFDVLSMQST